MAIRRDVRVEFLGRDRTDTAVRSVTRGLNTVNSGVSRVSRNVVNMQRAFSALTLGFAGNNIVRTLGELQTSTARLSNLSNDLGNAQAFIAKEADRLSIKLTTATDAYSKLQVLQAQGIITQSQQEKLFTGLGDAIAYFGASAEQVENVVYGMNQALGQGRIQAQELNQIVEPLPGLLNILARNAGKTASEYRDLAAAGDLTSKEFGVQLVQAFADIEGAAERLRGNIPQTLTRLASAYQATIRAFEQPISDSVSVFADTAAAALQGLVKHADSLKLIAEGVALAFGARTILAIGSFISAQGQAAIVSRAHTLALVEQNKRLAEDAVLKAAAIRNEIKLLSVEKARIAGLITGNAQKQVSTNLSRQLVAATEAQHIAQTRLNVITNVSTATVVRYTAAQRAAAVANYASATAAGVLSSAYALLGGGTGVITIAALAVGYYLKQLYDTATRINEIEKATKRFSAAAGGTLSSVEIEVNQKRINVLLDEREGIIENIRNAQDRLSKETDASSFGTLATIAEYNAKLLANKKLVEDNQREIKAYEERTAAIKRVLDMFTRIENVNFETGFTVSIDDYINKYIPSREKIKSLEDAKKQILFAFAGPEFKRDRDELLNIINEEIEALNPLKKSQDEYRRKVEQTKTEYKSIVDELATVRESIESAARDRTATIKLAFEYGTISEDELKKSLARSEEARKTALAVQAKKELQALIDTEKHKTDIEKTAIDQRKAYRDRIIEATSSYAPRLAAEQAYQAGIADLFDQRAKGEIKSASDMYALLVQLAIKYKDELQTVTEQIEKNQKKSFTKMSTADKFEFASGIATNFISSFQKEVGAYQALTDAMTDAQRKSAVESNRINAKKLADNKKWQKAQVAVNIASAIARAYSDYNFATATAIAAGLFAIGLKQIQTINSARLSGSEGTSVGSTSQVNPNQASIDAKKAGGPSVNVVILNNGFLTKEQQRNLVIKAFADANTNDEISIPGFSVNRVLEAIG